MAQVSSNNSITAPADTTRRRFLAVAAVASVVRPATIFATQLLNMGQDRAVSDSQRPTPKPNGVSRIDINDDLLG
jgi:hypothetical protein